MNQETALDILKSGTNVFLTGSAGAGKTYVLNQYIAYLRDNSIRVAVTASTGIAATHIDGMTIHSWSGMGIQDDLELPALKSLKARKYLKDNLCSVSVLVIDEISMLHRRQFELLDKILKFFRDNQEPFGGVQLVLCGDFFQLPPVGNHMETVADKFVFMSPAWVEAKLQICYLTTSYRQKNDRLLEALNHIRSGEDILSVQTFLSALVEKSEEFNSDARPRLFTHNTDVDSLNLKELNALKSEPATFNATLKGAEKLRELLKKSVMTTEQLVLKPGAKVMFVKNNFEKGYMNGTLGEVIEFSENGFPMVKVYSGEMIEAEPEDWKIVDDAGKTLAVFSQVPLRPAWAITIHKSQGMTLDAAELDLSKCFERGQGYVALSRLKTEDGIKLLGFNETSVMMDPLASKADKRFRELSAICEVNFDSHEIKHRQAYFINKHSIKKEKEKQKKAKNLKKITTYEHTHILLKKGLSIDAIAKTRNMSSSTVLSHIHKLKSENADLEIEHLRPDFEQMQWVQEAVETQRETGKSGLKDLHAILENRLTYDELKLCLMFLEAEV